MRNNGRFQAGKWGLRGIVGGSKMTCIDGGIEELGRD